MSRTMKIAAVLLLTAAAVGTVDDAYARTRYYAGGHYRHYGHRGYNPGPAIAGAALGILGAATAGIAADRYYNGYPAYTYGSGYGPRYGYDYFPDRGYYGPY